MSGAASLRIYRPSEFADRWRAYKIFVNDEMVGKLRRKRALEVPCPAGRITVVAKIDWCHSAPLVFDITEGSHAELRVRNTYGLLQATRAIDEHPDTYLTLEFATEPDS